MILQPLTSSPDLLKLSTELSKLGSELTEVGTKLAHAAATLQEETANIAEELSKQWGVDVSVNVGVRPNGRVNGGYETTVVKKQG